jgi:hypothetical protein
MPFQNMGQPLNRLGCEKVRSPYFRLPVPEGKEPVFRSGNMLAYYHVPTPYSRLFYLSGNKQGQMLDSKIGININPRWYIGTGYRGLSSLGYYRHSVASHENWFINTEYRSLNEKFRLRMFIVKNHLENEENGGITNENYFENPGKDYIDRAKIPVNTEDKSIWHSREWGFESGFRPLKNKKTGIFYQFNYLKSYYAYDGGNPAMYGQNLPAYSLHIDSTAYRFYLHRLGIEGEWKNGHWKTGMAVERNFRIFDTALYVNTTYIPRLYLDRYTSVFGSGDYRIKNLKLRASSAFELKGRYAFFNATLAYSIREADFSLHLFYDRHQPDFAYRSWQSRFTRFNWHTENTPLQTVSGWGIQIHGKNWKIFWENRYLKNKYYFDENLTPAYYTGVVPVWSVTGEYHLKWRKFGFYPQIKWQYTPPENPALSLPAVNIRTLLYYNDLWFHKKMRMQTGLEVRYFSEFYLPGYNPLLNVFYQQRQRKYGNFYLASFFFDFKVKKFKAFLTFEHFNAIWERFHPRYYSAPSYPYADYFLRTGIIWEFVN